MQPINTGAQSVDGAAALTPPRHADEEKTSASRLQRLLAPTEEQDDAENRLASLAAHVRRIPKAAHLDFSVDPQTGATTVRVIDSESGDVLREVPVAQLKADAAAVRGALGMLFDRPA